MSEEENKPTEETPASPEPTGEEQPKAEETHEVHEEIHSGPHGIKASRRSFGDRWDKLGFKSKEDFHQSQDNFVSAVMASNKDRLLEQPSKSSSHNLALQQNLGLLAELVFYGRKFLDVWGEKCKPVDFKIGVVLQSESGEVVQHGIGLRQLVDCVDPCGEQYAKQIDASVLKSLRHVCFALAVVTREACDLHAAMEKDLFKDTSEAEAEAKTSGVSETGLA